MSSILLVEDHVLFAQAIKRMLTREPNLNIVAVFPSGEEALDKLLELNVDLVILDVSYLPPHMDGIDLVQRIHTKYPHLCCLMLSGHKIPQSVKRSLNAGARGYILKDNLAGILEGIQRVLNGGVYVS
jgi:DNA-binding NarL/FixJ family response regulator